MDKDIVISINDITKAYKLYNSPKDRLKEAINPFGKKYHKTFNALNHLSIEVGKGETVGIIGKNGSGKSTLLKLITGVLSPTSGVVSVRGKISALLELGAAFNPEMTGLENIYFNMTLLDFSREQVENRLDDILSFADIGDFVYQPVKTYSSGMFVRLAFAVAVNVDPDILIVDEALSVGDIKFQFKCLRKMQEFKDQGKTFLFVTHSVETVRNLCNRAIWLMDGAVYRDGDSKSIVKDYSNYMTYDMIPAPNTAQATTNKAAGDPKTELVIEWDDISNCNSIGEREALITRVAFYHMDPYSRKPLSKVSTLQGSEWLVFLMEVLPSREFAQYNICANIINTVGNLILGINNDFIRKQLPPLEGDSRVVFRFEFKMPLLKDGKYSISCALAEGFYNNHVQQHVVHDALTFQIIGNELSQKHQYISISEATINLETAQK
jgi:ABC-type polysaccharide/polyol phosphate transport system ATPase subunit